MRILVLRNEPPWPLCYGGRLHCYELCRRLAARHELLLVAQRPCETDDWTFNFNCRVACNGRLYEERVDLADAEFQTDRMERYFGIDMPYVRDVVRFAREWKPDVVIGMNYQSLAALSRMSGVPRICDLQDDEALHALRELTGGCARSRWDALKCMVAALRFQRAHIRKIDAVTVLSETDRRFCTLHTEHPRVVSIPHGVDCAHYGPSGTPVDEKLISFWGGLAFGPNLSAVLYFADKVWPLICRAKPDMRWIIMGRGNPPQLQRLRNIRGIEILGLVDDIRPHVARSAAAVVPMVSGAGIKNKIMEAWAMGKPVICTPRALGDLPGAHAHNVWLAKTPDQLAQGVLRVTEDRSLREALGKAGRDTAVQQCSWDHAADQLERLCHELIREGMRPATTSRAAGDLATAGGTAGGA